MSPYRLLARLRSLWRGVRRRSDVEAEMREEFRHHIAARTSDLIAREGLDPAEARRRAHREFGHIEAHLEDGRASRQLHIFDRLGFSWLDFKLGVRMLTRYPGLSLVAGLAMAFAIWVAVGTFEFVNQFVHPTLPLPGGGEVVGIRYWDREEAWSREPTTFDFAVWREQVTTVENLGAWRVVERNLVPPGGAAEPAEITLISPSAFEVAGVEPLLGRVLTSEDAAPDAPGAVVLGHRLWQRRFGGDRGVVGRTVRLGTSEATVVGVMPAGFAFPVSNEIWTALPDRPPPAEPATGRPLRIFGRLAPGAGLPDARAQVAVVTERLRAEWPGRYEHLGSQVLPHAESVYRFSLDGQVGLALYGINVAVALLLLLIASDVAMLMFARVAAREEEILVRSALGAGRRRIVGQLFVEAVILVGLAAVVGTVLAGRGMAWGLEILRLQMEASSLPFWIDAKVSPLTVLYAVGLTLLAAVLAGVVPAWKLTGRGMERRLGNVGTGSGRQHFGRFWTTLTVCQITLTVIFAATAMGMLRASESVRRARVGIPAEEYLGMLVMMDEPEEGFDATLLERYHASVTRLEERLLAASEVRGVTMGEHLPVMYHPHAIIEVDGGGSVEPDPQWGGGYRVSSTSVAGNFFEVFGAAPVAGRVFDSRDLRADANVVVVNRSFVEMVLGGRSAIGRRIRYAYRERNQWDGPPDPSAASWHEIVGVVPDLGRKRSWRVDGIDPKVARVYRPLPQDREYPLNLAVHVPGASESVAFRVRKIAADVDSSLRLHDVRRLDEWAKADIRFYTFWSVLTLVLGGVALTLSMAGIYSVTSFMVSRRTREIGVRIALGAEPRRIVAQVLRRPLLEVGGGILVGCALVALFFTAMADAGSGAGRAAWGIGEILGWVTGLGAVMAAVCLLATLRPVRRALRIEPSQVLAADG